MFDQRPVGIRLVRAFAEDLAERPSTRLAGKQPEQVAGDVFEEYAARQLRFDIRTIRAQQLGA